MVTLLCTVRGCRDALTREARRFVCGRGHSFDVARSGYVNLLQPQDRRSRNPGDSAEAVAARRRVLQRGLGEPFVAPMVEMLRGATTLLDAGCGEGYHLGAFHAALQCEAHGTDISTPAIDLAAKTYRECSFVIANADRSLPYADGSFEAVTSITARLNPDEFARVLAPDGRLLVALAGPDDLIELREAILGEGRTIDRVERTLHDFAPRFSLVRQNRVTAVAQIDRATAIDIMTSSYRGLRASQREKIEELPAEMSVTLSRDVLVLA